MTRPISSAASALLSLLGLAPLACCLTAPAGSGPEHQAPIISPEPSALAPGAAPRTSLPPAPGPLSSSTSEPAPAPEPLPPLPPPGDAVKRLAERVRALEIELSAFESIEITGPDRYDVQLPVPARAKLKQLKDATVALLSARLGEVGDDLVPTQTRLTEALSGAFVKPPGDSDSLGAISALQVDRPFGHPERVVVVVTYRLPCGSDDALWLLERQAGGVKPVLAVRADGYASILDGRLASSWAVSPPDSSGNYFVTAAHAHPWCTSAWRGVEYQAFAPGPDADHPRRLARHAEGAFLNGAAADFEVSENGFEVRWASWDTLGGSHTRIYTHRWQRGPSGFARVTPEVRLPHDLLSELLDQPWAVAEGLLAPSAREAGRTLHARLSGKRPSGERSFRVDDKEPTYDAGSLPDAVTVDWTCQQCAGFPEHLRYRAERRGKGWIIAELSTPAAGGKGNEGNRR